MYPFVSTVISSWTSLNRSVTLDWLCSSLITFARRSARIFATYNNSPGLSGRLTVKQNSLPRETSARLMIAEMVEIKQSEPREIHIELRMGKQKKSPLSDIIETITNQVIPTTVETLLGQAL